MLDANQLEALAAVLEHGSFGAAARSLNLTLAAVSLRIRSLETRLGQRLLVRGKTVRATPAGRVLQGHVKQLRLMEADLIGELQGGKLEAESAWKSLAVAVNADSLSSWFLPGMTALLAEHRILLDLVVDDQDHTHEALRNGDVLGCVSTQALPMKGCLAEPLGVMRYRCVAAPAIARQFAGDNGALAIHRLLATPAVIFNRKDGLTDAFLAKYFRLTNPNYPRHFVPAVDAFESALEHGFGWGMLPEVYFSSPVKNLKVQDIAPGSFVDVSLYWHHWKRETASAERLTRAVMQAARAALV
jgi:LysR family transcriptional regulator (chromosome initiation inhibitor)